MKPHRFSKKSLIDRYFRSPNGYLIIVVGLFLFDEIKSQPEGSQYIGGQIIYWLSDPLDFIFGGYSISACLVIFILVLIIDAEIKFNRNAKEVKE